MAWNAVAVNAPPSSARVDFDDISPDVAESVEELFANLAATQRAIVPFETAELRDAAKVEIRVYCEGRKDGRLTASVWSGYTDAEGTGKFNVKETDKLGVPALSLAFTLYVKRERAGKDGLPS